MAIGPLVCMAQGQRVATRYHRQCEQYFDLILVYDLELDRLSNL